VTARRGRRAGLAERRVFKSYASLSSVPTDELEVLAGFVRNSATNSGPNHAGLVGPVVMAELARRSRAECHGGPHPDDPDC